MLRTLFGSLVLAAAPVPASAGCFEDLGRTGCTYEESFSVAELRRLSCDALWLVRNSIYADHAYCFRTQAAIQTFGNEGCRATNAANLPLNRHEQTNVNRIVQVEREMGCR